MKNQRPKNLNLLTIRLPIPALVSILHRISGVILFLFIPLLLWGLNLSLRSPLDFEKVHDFFSTPFTKLVIWAGLSAFAYHFIAGIRHLLMDGHLGEDLKSGRLTAWVTMILSGLIIVLIGIWLW